jgi:hypothetical protein
MPLAANMPVGTIVHNVELKPGAGGKLARSAGAPSRSWSARTQGYAQVKLSVRRTPPGPVRMHGLRRCRVQPGQQQQELGKAGRSRWLGRKPHQRGVVDEPGRPSASAVVKAVPRVAGIRSPRGASRRRARRPATTSVRRLHRPQPSQREETLRERRRCHAAYGKVRSSTAIS